MKAQLIISPVFKGLTRQPTFFGVDYNYCLISGMFCLLAFIDLSSFLGLLLFFPLHLIGWVLCQIDPHIFKLLMIRAQIGRVKNFRLWGCQTYSPLGTVEKL